MTENTWMILFQVRDKSLTGNITFCMNLEILFLLRKNPLISSKIFINGALDKV